MKRLIVRLFVVILIVISIWFIFNLPYLLSLPKRSAEIIRVGVVNLNYENKSSGPISKFLTKIDCNIVVLLEWTGNNLNLDFLKEQGFKAILDHSRSGTHGVCVIVKDLGTAKAKLIKSPVKGPCRIPVATVRFFQNNMNFTLFGVHAPPPVPGCNETTEPTLKAVSGWISKGKLRENIGVGRKEDIVIIAGDLNTIPFNSSMKCFYNSGLQDAYSKANWLPGSTWSPFSWLPALIRIDYIFISKNIHVLNSWTLSIPGSDHRAVVADIKM